MELWKLGCRWGSRTPLFYDFIKENNILIGWIDKDYSLDSYLLITDGFTVLDIASVKSKRKSVLEFPHFKQIFEDLKIPFNEDIFIYEACFFNIRKEDQFKYSTQQGIIRVRDNEAIRQFNEIRNKTLMKNKLKQNVNLLKYKKQIILQGPPGTGKTREAKMIAEELIGNNSKVSDLKQYFKVGQKINSTSGITSYYDVLEVHANKITVKNEKAVENREISLEIINDTISQIKTGQVDKSRVNYAYESALANYLLKEVKSNDQIKLIQFHPSYTYEDFVRGIVSKPSEDRAGIVYEAENKLLADFAQRALESYNKPLTPMWKVFRDFLNNWTSENHEELYFDNEKTVRLLDVFQTKEDNAMLRFETFYHGTQSWHMQTWIDIKDLFNNENYNNNFKGYNYASNEIKIICDYFIKFIKKEYISSVSENYVLIIDEINRANLSSVLGELIYALEYRGEAVESMYAVGNDSKLILPPNLYIIGTMNTADRSVGHIDYAIRRRFAFVDVLPKDLSDDENIIFDAELFYNVEQLFDTNLSPEFEKKDVQLGHSYFIDKSTDGGFMDIRLEYEIKPILFEYVKEGVLIGDDIKKLIDDLEPSI